ncbi:iron chaperone [Candidatus Thiodiazotropha endoloripes]|uniref:YdhG-like domain-containing protein n=1 Tax=Candidatus Thiodiazotropha endoloripes TaxID=1818881 RepID=A0A1E2UNE3_9GAMM|nr:DUF1801 domain-containing protein [Candidatus Thiodiazotropha endoloripes]ODB96253.1 hypothetical protein A3196_05435 [Candidatus Thiodiazotropha endoloripes]
MMKTVDRYIADLPEERKQRFMLLHQMIMSEYPDLIVDMHYKMPTYRLGEGWVALANQKNYISLYTCSATHIDAFKTKYPQIKTGKGCINFKDKDPLPLDDLVSVVHHAISEAKGH